MIENAFVDEMSTILTLQKIMCRSYCSSLVQSSLRGLRRQFWIQGNWLYLSYENIKKFVELIIRSEKICPTPIVLANIPYSSCIFREKVLKWPMRLCKRHLLLIFFHSSLLLTSMEMVFYTIRGVMQKCMIAPTLFPGMRCCYAPQ